MWRLWRSLFYALGWLLILPFRLVYWMAVGFLRILEWILRA